MSEAKHTTRPFILRKTDFGLLWAAAPDLLEALRACAEIADTVYGEHDCACDDPGDNTCYVCKTRAALAKAEPAKHDDVYDETVPPIHEVFAEIMADVPPEELAKLPVDGAANHDKYLYEEPER